MNIVVIKLQPLEQLFEASSHIISLAMYDKQGKPGDDGYIHAVARALEKDYNFYPEVMR